jgi:two-component system, NarL family, response regulator
VNPVPPSELTVLVADDHPVTLEGLALILERQPGIRVVAQATNGEEAVRLYAELRPRVALLDIRMPLLDGSGATTQIRRIDPQARIILLSALSGDQDISRGLNAGASGYLLKDGPVAELLEAIAKVAAGGRYLSGAAGTILASRMSKQALTSREDEVLRLAALGLSNKEIAGRLGISEGTVKSHLNSVMQKLEVGSRTQAAKVARERGLLAW